MAREAPRLSLVIGMLVTIVVLCGGLMVAMKYGEVQLKDHQEKEAKKKPAPTGPYADRILKLDTRVHSVTQGSQDDVAGFGKYCDNTDPGLYLDVVSDEVLFSSRDKLPSSIGFAEFARPVDPARLIEEPETVNGEPRIRVKSKKAGTRLGWTGPEPETKQPRYFLNSTALRFVPAADLEKEKLGDQRPLLEKP